MKVDLIGLRPDLDLVDGSAEKAGAQLIGNVLISLKENGFADTTNIAYISDHGDNMGARGLWGKSVMYEEAVGVPMLLSGPDVPKRNVVRTPVSLIDIFPTILAGVDVDNPDQVAALPGLAGELASQQRTGGSGIPGVAVTCRVREHRHRSSE